MKNKRAQRALERSSETEYFKSSLFHRLMYNRRHLRGLNLKAKALKCKSDKRIKFNVIKCQSSIPQTKLYKWSKFEGLSCSSIHNNCLRFDLVCLPFMSHI